MTDNLNVFPNARPKLLGEAEDSEAIIDTEAIAGLSGSSAAVAGDSGAGFFNGGTSFREDVPNDVVALVGQTLDTDTVNVPAGSIVVIFLCSENGNGPGVIKVRNTTTSVDKIALSMVTGGGLTITLNSTSFVDSSPDVGNNSYAMIGVSGAGFKMQMILRVVDVTDNHQGIITTPATATKQINSPDTYRTHEQAVLPG